MLVLLSHSPKKFRSIYCLFLLNRSYSFERSERLSNLIISELKFFKNMVKGVFILLLKFNFYEYIILAKKFFTLCICIDISTG